MAYIGSPLRKSLFPKSNHEIKAAQKRAEYDAASLPLQKEK